MVIAEVGLGELLWSLLVLYLMFVYLMVLYHVVLDLFRDDGVTGGAKALWTVSFFVFPLASVVVYLVVRGGGMSARSLARAGIADGEFKGRHVDYVDTRSPAEEIAKAKELLDAGAIDASAYEALKTKALA